MMKNKQVFLICILSYLSQEEREILMYGKNEVVLYKALKNAWVRGVILLLFTWPLTSHTVRNLYFLSKNSTMISRENGRFFWVKNSWKCCGFGLFSCWQLWFHAKNCQKNFGWKTRENVGVLSKLNFWTKIWLL